MLQNYYNLYLYMFFAALLTFVLTRQHLLSTVLALEFMAISSYLILTFSSLVLEEEYFCVFLFVSVVVCEGVLALSLVILYVRSKGKDFFKPVN